MGKREKTATTGRERQETRAARLVRTPVWPGQDREKAEEEPARSCHDCAFCLSDSLLWARTLLSGFPVLGLCANHPDTPGQLREIPYDGPCRNFRPRLDLGRVEPPEPPNDEVRYIPLTRGLHAIVDTKNYEWLSRYKWHAWVVDSVGTHYACRTHRGRTIFMHREIMKTPRGRVVDHINGNGLDNREANTRNCTQAQNMANNHRAAGKSRFQGVYPSGDKWQAAARHQGKRFHVGTFEDEVEAAKARDRKMYELAGEFAYLNFPDEIPRPRRG